MGLLACGSTGIIEIVNTGLIFITWPETLLQNMLTSLPRNCLTGFDRPKNGNLATDATIGDKNKTVNHI